MFLYYLFAILGVINGFILFTVNLESDGMRGILIRVDQNGEKRCNPNGLINYLINPFISQTLWYPQLLCVNWIVMTNVYMIYWLLFAHILYNCFV